MSMSIFVYVGVCLSVCMCVRLCVYVVLLASCCALDMRVRYYGLILLTW